MIVCHLRVRRRHKRYAQVTILELTELTLSANAPEVPFPGAEAVALVPELALVEAAQVLHKKTRAGTMSTSDADEIMTTILELPLEVVGHRELLASAVLIAREEVLTVYDAVFLALAATSRAELITADDRLAAAARNRGH